MANTFKSYMAENSELKSHSSALTNERISAILAAYDTEILIARNSKKLEMIERAYNTIHVLWSNIRTLARFFPDCRQRLNLDTEQDGVYKIDVVDHIIDTQLERIHLSEEQSKNIYTRRMRRTLIKHVEYMASESRDVLQYFKFNFRTDNRQNPDIFSAVDSEFVPDENTIRQLAGVVGKKNKIDFERYGKQLGTTFNIEDD